MENQLGSIELFCNQCGTQSQISKMWTWIDVDKCECGCELAICAECRDEHIEEKETAQ